MKFVRFSRDLVIEDSRVAPPIELVNDHHLVNNFLVDEASSPYLDRALMRVSDRIKVDRGKILFFVNPSPDFQASCYASSGDQCLVTISSALVDLLDAEELEFVLGHELGHYVFEHYRLGDRAKGSLEYYALCRAQEISSDRLGLLGCGDLTVATSAIIKTTSGLKSQYLGLNVGQFISQLNKLSNRHRREDGLSTHPTFLLRCRALLWFSSIVDWSNPDNSIDVKELAEVDRKVEGDLADFVDGPIRDRINEVTKSYAAWSAIKVILADGRFDKNEQAIFADQFGNEFLEKIKMILSSNTGVEVMEIVDQKVNAFREDLEACCPISYLDKISDIKRENSKLFS